jgi:hypothetical protein
MRRFPVAMAFHEPFVLLGAANTPASGTASGIIPMDLQQSAALLEYHRWCPRLLRRLFRLPRSRWPATASAAVDVTAVVGAAVVAEARRSRIPRGFCSRSAPWVSRIDHFISTHVNRSLAESAAARKFFFFLGVKRESAAIRQTYMDPARVQG